MPTTVIVIKVVVKNFCSYQERAGELISPCNKFATGGFQLIDCNGIILSFFVASSLGEYHPIADNLGIVQQDFCL